MLLVHIDNNPPKNQPIQERDADCIVHQVGNVANKST